MKKTLALTFALLPVFAFAAKPPTQEEMDNADYGPEMTQEAVEGLARKLMDGVLKDPVSAQWKCEPIRKGWVNRKVRFKTETTFVWQVNCQINAKNSYGGYTGFQEHRFYARDGVLIHASVANKSRTGFNQIL